MANKNVDDLTNRSAKNDYDLGSDEDQDNWGS